MGNGLLKLVYTWDYRMRWAPVDRPTVRGTGGMPYSCGEKTFLEDYRRAIRWFSRHGYDGIVVWGGLRDSHGGVHALKEVCRIAEDHGIKIIAGVGVYCYGGTYWEGHHPYNIDTWINKNPHLAAVDLEGKPIIREPIGGSSMLCASRPENLQWYCEALDWLLNEVPVQGIWLETGDYGLCQCPACQDRPGHVRPYSYAAMADVVPTLMRRVHTLRPEVMLVTISYGTIPYYLSLGLNILERHLPDFAHCSWIFEGGIGWQSGEQDLSCRSVLQENSNLVRAVTKNDLAFVQYNAMSCYDEGLIVVDRIRQVCRMCHEKGIRGVMQMGELREPCNLINYLALDFYTRNPQATLWEGLQHVLQKKNICVEE